MSNIKQFDLRSTFFDIGIDETIDNFATLYCVMGETSKKRNNITRLALQYLLDKKCLSKQEQELAESILDDSFYKKPKKYSHCKLCSSDFERFVLHNYSSQFQFWDVCFPTIPYFPGGMMIYLKNREEVKKENIQDLNIDELRELKYIIADLKSILNKQVFGGELTGINVLFNQISKSQLCIHGHVELMIKNIDKYDYGCKLLDIRNYDPCVKVLNNCFNNEHVMPTIEGIRINMKSTGDEEAINYIGEYENRILDLIKLGKDLRISNVKVNNDFEQELKDRMSPAPTNSIYLTDYRDELYLSSVPEIMPPTINLNQVGDINDYENLYLIKYNATTPNKEYAIMKKYSPIVRPSSKVPYELSSSSNVRRLAKCVEGVLK